MTAIQAIEILKQVRNRGDIFSEDVTRAIGVAITALENIGVDSVIHIQQYKNYLAQAIVDFRVLGEHRPKSCNMTFCSCDNCPLDVSIGGRQTCDKWVLEDEVLPLLGDLQSYPELIFNRYG